MMKSKIENSNLRIAPLISGVVSLLLVIATVPALDAQSADVFLAKPKVPADVGGNPQGKELVAEPVDDTPSRFFGDQVERYIAARAAVFSMRDRVTGPFGLYQDPNRKPDPPKHKPKGPINKPGAQPETPLGDIVKLIRVTTIIPGGKEFLVGIRKFAEGDEFVVKFQGNVIRLKIVEVSSRSILFRSIESGETAALKIDVLPPGMSPGGDTSQPPGMVSPLEDIPLELGTGNEPDPIN